MENLNCCERRKMKESNENFQEEDSSRDVAHPLLESGLSASFCCHNRQCCPNS